MDDLISRQAVIETLDHMDYMPGEWAVNGLTMCKDAIKALPSAQPEQPSEIQDILDYLETALHPIISPEHWNVYSELHDMISTLPTAQQDCTECPEYDNETKSCPRYCKVIRRTLVEAKQERVGRWELIDDTEFLIPGYRCYVCHCECEDWDKKPTYRFCPNCGARMEEDNG